MSHIGFTKINVAKNVLKGLALGTSCFVAYLVEMHTAILYEWKCQNFCVYKWFLIKWRSSKAKWYYFILICIAFNIINVWMEEGIFVVFSCICLKVK